MRFSASVLAVGFTVSLAACGSPGTTSSDGTDGNSLTVFAAASLNHAFPQIAKRFEATHPKTKVQFTFNGSADLVDQLQGGAPADVLATADRASMTRAEGAGLTEGTPAVFAGNVLTLVTAPGNPEHITGLNASLTGKKLVVCAPQVPCGNATRKLADRLHATLKPVSQEQSVTDVLGKVTSGEADAGVVYRTDAKSAGSTVATVAVPGAEKVVNRYPIAVAAGSHQRAMAQEFVAYVDSAAGRAVLRADGFTRP